MATGRALLDLLDLLEREQLREAATAVYTNFSNPELELYAAVRALEESEAEIEARPAPFPASLPPWLVMQWLPIREVPAAFDAVDFLESEGWLTSLTEVNEEYYHWATNRYLYGLAPLQQRVNDCHVAIHLQPHVLDYYTKFATSDEGLHSNAVAAALRIDLPELRAAVNFLASEGHLYATIDEDHHKSAECVLYTEPDD